MGKRDLEEACWVQYDGAVDDGNRVNALKALDLLVKIRLAGDRVKGDKAKEEDDDSVSQAWKSINGTA